MGRNTITFWYLDPQGTARTRAPRARSASYISGRGCSFRRLQARGAALLARGIQNQRLLVALCLNWGSFERASGLLERGLGVCYKADLEVILIRSIWLFL